jgi:hypothetical protein
MPPDHEMLEKRERMNLRDVNALAAFEKIDSAATIATLLRVFHP